MQKKADHISIIYGAIKTSFTFNHACICILYTIFYSIRQLFIGILHFKTRSMIKKRSRRSSSSSSSGSSPPRGGGRRTKLSEVASPSWGSINSFSKLPIYSSIRRGRYKRSRCRKGHHRDQKSKSLPHHYRVSLSKSQVFSRNTTGIERQAVQI